MESFDWIKQSEVVVRLSSPLSSCSCTCRLKEVKVKNTTAEFSLLLPPSSSPSPSSSSGAAGGPPPASSSPSSASRAAWRAAGAQRSLVLPDGGQDRPCRLQM